MPSAEEVVADANALTGRAWRVVAEMAGGHQNGAHLIEDDDGQYVLKWSARVDWAERVAHAAHLVAQARGAGYPTPEWIAQGNTRDGFPFHVVAFVAGEQAHTADPGMVEEMMRVTALQREITFTGATDWTWYVDDVVFNNHAGHQTDLMAAGDATAEAVRRAVELASPRPHSLPNRQMVHGDFSSANVLVRDGRIVAVIDIEAIGMGCASFDLLTPARQDYIWGDRTVGPRLMEEAVRRDGPEYFAVAVAAHAINILAFGLDRWPPADVQGAAHDVLRWLADSRSLVK